MLSLLSSRLQSPGGLPASLFPAFSLELVTHELHKRPCAWVANRLRWSGCSQSEAPTWEGSPIQLLLLLTTWGGHLICPPAQTLDERCDKYKNTLKSFHGVIL